MRSSSSSTNRCLLAERQPGEELEEITGLVVEHRRLGEGLVVLEVAASCFVEEFDPPRQPIMGSSTS